MSNTSHGPGISILLVDDDPICLSILAGVLQKMNHRVVATTSPLDALCTLRMRTRSFDLVLTDVHMPEMSGLELLEHAKQEFKLPVILMSADKDKDIMLKGLEVGAVYYFLKPLSSYNLSRLWQFAIPSSTQNTNKTLPLNKISLVNTASAPNTSNVHDQPRMIQVVNNNNNNKNKNKNKNNNNINNFAPLLGGQFKENTAFFNTNVLKRPTVDVLRVRNNSGNKKPKLVWTTSLHNIFLEAVNSIGLEKAVPKKILELMNVPGLRRENVASHLQKYRLFLKRISEATIDMEDGVPNNWNEKPFRSSFVLNEITFLTNNLQQQYKELLAQTQGKMNEAKTFEEGQSSTQVLDSSEGNSTDNHIEVVPDDHIQIYPNQEAQTPNENATKVDELPSPIVYQQEELPAEYCIEQEQYSPDDNGITLSNPGVNNYVGLRLSTNGELIGTLKSTITSYENGGGNNSAKDIHEINYNENNIGAQEINYAMNFAYNNYSFHQNSPIVDHYFGMDDVNVLIPNLDHNATPQHENSFGMSQEMPNLHGIGDELRQLGIDIHVDQESIANNYGFEPYDVQVDDQGSWFERTDPGIISNDDISFACYFAQEYGQEFNQQDGRVDFTNPN